jgi:hypothetical protein
MARKGSAQAHAKSVVEMPSSREPFRQIEPTAKSGHRKTDEARTLWLAVG